MIISVNVKHLLALDTEDTETGISTLDKDKKYDIKFYPDRTHSVRPVAIRSVRQSFTSQCGGGINTGSEDHNVIFRSDVFHIDSVFVQLASLEFGL